jgi:hypothetical protein
MSQAALSSLRQLSLRAIFASLIVTAGLFPAQLSAQQPNRTSVVPRLVNFSGKVVDSSAKPVSGPASVVFAIYKDEEGGEAFWREMQNVMADAEGNYTVQLGATQPGGLPLDLFSSGDSRWLGVSVNGANERPRALLLSVPYALKAADAETLGGLPASAYMRADGSNAVHGVVPAVVANKATSAVTPKATANPAITGLGAIGFVPLFDTTSDVLNSNIFQNGSNVGIGTKTASGLLDVNGTATVRDSMTLVPKGTDPVLTVRNTLFAINSSGLVSFDTGQTFPGVGTIKGVTAGAGLQGGGTSGTVALSIATGGVLNAMLKNSSFTLPVTSPLTGGGAISLGTTAAALALKPCPAGELYISNGTTWSCTAAAGTGKVTSVGFTAPTSDFLVTGSPVTTAGTLALNWNVAPTPSNVANAIAKRDVSGGLSVGYLNASFPGSGVAISGVSAQSVGVYGESDGTESGANGVQGTSYANGGSGVAGFADSGIGVYGQGSTGLYGSGTTGVYGTGILGFATDSNVQQARSAGGWVKAMVYVQAEQAPYTITRCFNSTLTGAAATTAPCGIVLHEVQPGDFQINFNFQVSDRFFATTIGNNSDATIIQVYATGADQLEAFTFDNDINYKGAEYSLIVF